MSTRNDVLAEFTRGTVTRYYDTDAMRDEIVRLRETVAAVEAERDDALIDRRFSDEQRAKWMGENVALLHRAERAERERDEARRALAVLTPMFDLATKEGEGMMAVGLELMRLNKELTEEREAVALFIAQNRALRTRAERAERVVEAARPWIADLWRGDLNGTAIGVCMEYEPDGQYVLWEQVAPIVEAVRALTAASEGASDVEA